MLLVASLTIAVAKTERQNIVPPDAWSNMPTSAIVLPFASLFPKNALNVATAPEAKSVTIALRSTSAPSAVSVVAAAVASVPMAMWDGKADESCAMIAAIRATPLFTTMLCCSNTVVLLSVMTSTVTRPLGRMLSDMESIDVSVCSVDGVRSRVSRSNCGTVCRGVVLLAV